MDNVIEGIDNMYMEGEYMAHITTGPMAAQPIQEFALQYGPTHGLEALANDDPRIFGEGVRQDEVIIEPYEGIDSPKTSEYAEEEREITIVDF